MLSLRRIILSLSVVVFFSFPSLTLASKPVNSFASAEHIIIGDKIKLFFDPHDAGQSGYTLHLPNGLNLTYGDLISFGDFYGTPNEAISLGQSNIEREARFMAAFNSLANHSDTVSEANQILDVLHDEQKILFEGLAKGEKPEAIYQRIGSETGRKINCITGGGCSPTTWWISQGRYLLLAADDYDHFGTNAWIAYKTGHDLAIKEAVRAHQTGDKKRLEIAYAMNAFACHFLSDRFSAGHIRVPRIELPANVTPHVIGAILVGFMHNEESPYGLHVHNLRGNHWIAYGDKSYFNPKNTEHSAILNETLQMSANQIFSAYLQGSAPEDNLYDLIPQADEIGSASQQDISPLFYWDDQSKQLMRRKTTSNPYDRHWTAGWWGWSTLIELGTERELPIEFQASLVRAGYGKKAMQYGLITDKNIIDYVKSSAR